MGKKIVFGYLVRTWTLKRTLGWQIMFFHMLLWIEIKRTFVVKSGFWLFGWIEESQIFSIQNNTSAKIEDRIKRNESVIVGCVRAEVSEQIVNFFGKLVGIFSLFNVNVRVVKLNYLLRVCRVYMLSETFTNISLSKLHCFVIRS